MSDSDDDQPISQLMKGKKDDESEKSGPTKMDIDGDDDDDDDDAPISKLIAPAKRKRSSSGPAKKPAKPAAKPAAAKKKKSKKDSDDDDDDDDDDAMDEDDDDDDDDDDESEDEEDSEDEKPKKKKKKPAPKPAAKKPAKEAPAKKKKAAVKDEDDDDDEDDGGSRSRASKSRKPRGEAKGAAAKKKPAGGKKVKEEDDAAPAQKAILSSKAVRLEQAMKAFKWWDEEPLPQGLQWLGLEHNGIFFPPDYEPHGIKMLYDGQPVDLPPELEEVATFYASIPADGPQLGNEETAKIFQKNFFHEFKTMLSEKLDEDLGIKHFNKCDFSLIKEHLDQQKLVKKAATDEEKATAKREKERRQDFFGYAIVDGRLEKVGNYNMEPPGLFRGRGKHPLMGKIKQRVMPEKVAINIGPDARVPPCSLPGHAWDRVQHDNRVTWLACWKENILNGVKYVMLSASSSFKGKSDKEKYDKAARLKDNIGKIRHDYEQNLTSKDKDAKQLATAMWIIDKLALRVGGEKGEDEADTVGCCSLRREHLTFPDGDDVFEIELEFLGKDSMLFKQTIDFKSYGTNGVKVFRNLEEFCRRKKPQEDVFDTLTPTILNAHLSSLMPGLSAKVFRTYNASETLQNELPSPEDLEGMSVPDKVLAYNEANRKVAILCNHQRTVTKAMENTLENLAERLALLKEQKRELHQQKDLIKAGKDSKVRTREKDEQVAEEASAALKEAEEKKKAAKTTEQKIAATAAMEAAKELKKKAQALKAKDAHLFARTPTLEQVTRQLDRWTEKIKKLELDIRNKDDNKEVALGTSKINYMDPRISVAWCKRVEVPIERIFAKTLRDKFVWSMGVPPDWRFEGPKSSRGR